MRETCCYARSHGAIDVTGILPQIRIQLEFLVVCGCRCFCLLKV
jgi:hypothetical protein